MPRRYSYVVTLSTSARETGGRSTSTSPTNQGASAIFGTDAAEIHSANVSAVSAACARRNLKSLAGRALDVMKDDLARSHIGEMSNCHQPFDRDSSPRQSALLVAIESAQLNPPISC